MEDLSVDLIHLGFPALTIGHVVVYRPESKVLVAGVIWPLIKVPLLR
ncbi:unnamed protein product [Acidithrix sp. C25]|nr:unnamed protein product [Acidithrix sp. C25]